MNTDFIAKQKQRIENRIKKYKDKERIKDELLSGDVSPYTKYKQKTMIPILEKALERINKGQYGICLKCGGQIEKKRLLLVPAAELCLKCSNSN